MKFLFLQEYGFKERSFLFPLRPTPHPWSKKNVFATTKISALRINYHKSSKERMELLFLKSVEWPAASED